MIRPLVTCALGALLMLATGGCAVVGFIASKVPGAPQEARYPGLKGQRVAVVAWVDRASSYEYPSLIPKLESAVPEKLKAQMVANPKTEELLGTTFVDPRQVYKWQKNHPEYENRSVSEFAPQLGAALGVTRVVYVEISPFSTRDPRTEVLLKGTAGVTIHVAEVTGTTAAAPFNEANLQLEYPEHAPEGVPVTDSMTNEYVYNGLVDKISTEVSLRFFSYTPDE
jgi:hypothetical protein